MTLSCPWCLYALSGPTTYGCSSCDPQPNEAAGRVLGYAVSSPPVATVPVPAARTPAQHDPFSTGTVDLRAGSGDEPNCPDCGKTMRQRVCGRCLHAFPADFAVADGSTTVVLCGARAAGKTVYIDVVASYLQELPAMLRRRGVQLTVKALDLATVQADADSRRRMWEEGRAAERTQRVGDGSLPPPRVYGLTRRDGDRDRRHVLILRDVPGEELDHPEPSSIPAFAFMGRADLVLLLVDPFQIRAVRDRLSDLVPIGEQGYSDPQRVLQNVRILLDGQVPRRTAVALAKFDALHGLARVPDRSLSAAMASPGFAYHRDPGVLRPSYDQEDGLLLHEEVRSLLELLEAGAFLSQAEMELDGPRFFAVSALGHQPAGTALAASGVTAFRVMDPINWVLHDSGILADQIVLPKPENPPGPAPRRRRFGFRRG